MTILTSLRRAARGRTGGTSTASNSEWLHGQWRGHSLAGGWRFADDWDVPQTQALVLALVARAPLAEPAHLLGRMRAEQGIGIGETMGDIRALFTAASMTDDADTLQALAQGWAEGAERIPVESCTDPLTGLSTIEHFERCVVDLYDLPDKDPATYVLACIALHPDGGNQPLPWSELALLGLVAKKSFEGADVRLVLHKNTLHILMKPTEDNQRRARACWDSLDQLASAAWRPGSLQTEGLPAGTESVLGTIHSLRG